MDVPSKATNPATGSKEVKTPHSFYFSYLWNRIAGSFPCFPGSNFVGKISNLYFVTTRARPRKRRPCLPLPLPSKILDSFQGTKEASRFLTVLDDIVGNLFLNLHNIQKNLQFWQSKVEGSNVRKMYFILFERGPWAFVDETIKLIRDCLVEGSSIQNLRHHATAYISDRITILTKLRHSLATFLAQVYMEVDQSGEKLITDPEQALVKLLVTMNLLFLKLEASIGDLLAACESSFSVGNCSTPLRFEKLLEGNQEGSQWTDAGIRDAICLTYENLQRLDSCLSVLVAKIQKPRKVTLYWTRYTCVAIGFSICSFWLLRHSRLAGSSDIDNWIHEAKDSTIHFWNDHVEQPFFSIRDELFETFRKRHKGVMEIEEVQLTANSLHRMLLAFSKQTTGQDLPENTSDQEMLEIVMSRYEKELTHPIQNLLNGELARSLLIQVQKLKLDIETAMLELNQILRANEINFAILAALPAFFLSLLLLIVVRAWFKQDTRAEGKGRIARLQRRLLVVEVEKRIMQYQTCMDEGLEEDAQSAYGLTLYTLDRLCRAVERHAKATGEWLCLRQDIVDLGKPGLQTSYKLIITSRMERVYDCLLPALTRQ